LRHGRRTPKIMIQSFVGDTDRHVNGSPGSGSISQRYGSGSRSFPFLIKVFSGLK
jgi:hypothetical protein